MKRRSPRLRPAAVAVAAAVLAAVPAIPARADDSCPVVNIRWSHFALSGEPAPPPPWFYQVTEGNTAFIAATAGVEFCDSEGHTGTWTTTSTGSSAIANVDYTPSGDEIEFPSPCPGNPQCHGTITQFRSVPTLKNTSSQVGTYKTVNVTLTPTSSGATPGTPTTAPIHIIDVDGSPRFATVGGGPFNVQEAGGTFKFPIFRAGDASNSSTVSITYAGGNLGADFTQSPSSPVTFAVNERFKIVTITPVNDSTPESDQTVTVTLTGAPIDGPSSMSFKIIDNDGGSSDTTAPKTWFHHPRHNKDYAHGSYKARTIHVFAPTEDVDSPHGPMESSGIEKVQAALKRKKTNGNCQWWTAARTWKGGKCGAQKWFKVKFDFKLAADRYLYAYDLLTDLKPSKGTKIKYYQVYSRAEDGAGNMESTFEVGRNKNKFEINKKK